MGGNGCDLLCSYDLISGTYSHLGMDSPRFARDNCWHYRFNCLLVSGLIICLFSTGTLMEIRSTAPNFPNGLLWPGANAGLAVVGSTCCAIMSYSLQLFTLYPESTALTCVYRAGITRYAVPFDNIDQIILACLAASATAALLKPRRSLTALTHKLFRSLFFSTNRMTARAPCTNKVRK